MADEDIIDYIRSIAAYNARAPITSEHQITLFLKSWWSSTYNRPLKDPLLESYTLEELLYEFYDKMERQKAAEERVAKDADKIEEDKEKEVLDWAEQEEKRELEEMRKAAEKSLTDPTTDPTKDPKNVKWMEEQLEQAKQEYGASFGEDIDETFDGE
jgi:hypothetical protein